MRDTLLHLLCGLVCLVTLGRPSPARAYSIATFGPTQWQASDATLGVAGFTIEDFESTDLAPGFQVTVTTGLGDYGPIATRQSLLKRVGSSLTAIEAKTAKAVTKTKISTSCGQTIDQGTMAVTQTLAGVS